MNKLWRYFYTDILLVSILFYLAYISSLWLLWPIAILIGIVQHALGEIGHLASHKEAGKYSTLLATIIFTSLGLDLEKYKRFHFAHHRYLGSNKDPEVDIVRKFKNNWTEPYKLIDSFKDIIGLNIQESLYVMSKMATVRSLGIYVILLSCIVIYVNPLVLLWPLGAITGLLLAHRLRARTEHQHLTNPGITKPSIPPTWKTWWYLPHGTWKHYAHHHRK